MLSAPVWGPIFQIPSLRKCFGKCTAHVLSDTFFFSNCRNELEKRPGGAKDLSLEDAKALVEKLVGLSFLRDCRATNRYYTAVVSKTDGARVEGPFTAKSNWEIARSVSGY